MPSSSGDWLEQRDFRDGRLMRGTLEALRIAGRVIGQQRARRIAALIFRREASTDNGCWKLAHRVSPRLRKDNPALFKIPAEWTETAPEQRARRLGLDLELDLRDNLQAILYFGGTYEPALLRFFGSELRSGDVVADVGAHIGVHSLTIARRLAQRGGGRVYSFEPTTDSSRKLRVSAQRNGLTLTVCQTALGNTTGTLDLFCDPNYSDADAGVRSRYGNGSLVERVALTSFDEWAEAVSLDRLDIVKIDVEGSEPEVIAGMTRSLQQLRPRALVVEVAPYSFERAGTGSPEQLRDQLRTVGYASTDTWFHRNQLFRPTDRI